MTVSEYSVQSEKPFPLIWPSIGWAMLYLVLQIVIGVAVVAAVFVPLAVHDHALAQHLPKDVNALFKIPGFAYAVYASVIVPAAIMLLIFWRVLRVKGRAARIGFFAPSQLSLTKTLGLGVALLVAALAFETLYSRYVHDMKDAQQFIQLLITALPNTIPNVLIKLLAIVIAGPLIEEVLFRGYLQNALKLKLPAHVAIILTAIIFAVYHAQPAAIPTLAMVGLAIGYFYHYTGSLKWSMALHMFNNLVALLATLYGT